MPDFEKTLIMKFGGGILNDSDSFHRIAKIVALKKGFKHIVVVVSAMMGVTDHLIELAHRIHPTPPRREYDMLVSAGERMSTALLAMALDCVGRKGISFTGSQSGVITTADHTEARIVDVRPQRIITSLEQGAVAIVAGFQGVSEEKEITTLGRGGSDTTAVALAVALGGEVEFYKDVPGICDQDPKQVESPIVYPYLSYQEAYRIIQKTGGKVLHLRALELASLNEIPLKVLPFWDNQNRGTRIGATSLNNRRKPSYECRPTEHSHST